MKLVVSKNHLWVKLRAEIWSLIKNGVSMIELQSVENVKTKFIGPSLYGTSLELKRRSK